MRLEKFEEYRLLRAEFPKKKGRQTNEFYRRLILLKRKYLTNNDETQCEEEEKVPIYQGKSGNDEVGINVKDA